MSKYKIKGQPPIKLENILKKRRMSLEHFIKNMGITSYQSLIQKCNKMGVSPPAEKFFDTVMGGRVFSNPQEGFIVLDPPQDTVIVQQQEEEQPTLEEDALLHEENIEKAEISADLVSNNKKKKKRN